MKLLVSPLDLAEAMVCEKGGADIIDVKNPREGSLGANFPWVISEVKAAVNRPVSATLGDFDFKPGTASLAALGAFTAGADIVKIGLFGIKDSEQAEELLSPLAKVALGFPGRQVVAAGYADYRRLGCISPLELPPIAARAGCHGVLIDTGIKDRRTTFEFISEQELAEFIAEAHELGLFAALAGGIGFKDVPVVKRLAPDILGVRGVVCGGDRNEGIKDVLVSELRSILP